MTTEQDSDARMTRGLDMSKRLPITERTDGSFAVPSQTRQGIFYVVKVMGEASVSHPTLANREKNPTQSYQSLPETWA